MPPLVVANAWHVQVKFTDAQDAFTNVFAVGVAGGAALTQLEADSLLAVYVNAWDNDFKALQSSSVTLDSLTVTDIRAEGAPQFVASSGLAATGAGDRMPDQNSVCLTLRTAFRSPKGRGRMFLAGFTEGCNDAGGVVSAATVTGVEQFGADLIAGLSAASRPLQVIHRVLGAPTEKYPNGAPTGAGTAREVVSANVSNNVWKSQRRRRRAA